jgi:hypothetical protein
MRNFDRPTATGVRSADWSQRSCDLMNASPPKQDGGRSRWGPPPNSDLIGLPLFFSVGAAIVAVGAAFVLIGGFAGLLTLIAVLVLALGISYRVTTDSDPRD